MAELRKIPNTEDIEFKDKFKERYTQLLGDKYDDFIEHSLSFLRKAIRVNTLKISVDDLKKRLQDDWELTPVPWCKEAFWIKSSRRDVGNLLEHVLGYIYIQEPASMIPPIVLDPKPGDFVLDMCAAPGSKTTQLAQYMENKGLLVANEMEYIRIKALDVNLQRCGVQNAVISHRPGHKIQLQNLDKILVDAPCSGTGTIRKSLKTIRMWNPNVVRRIAGIQRQLIAHAFEMLKPGGEMVYSTCTLEPEENEAIVSFLLNKYEDASTLPIELNIIRSQPVLEWEDQAYHDGVKNCLRIYPNDNDTEGFFVCKIQKKFQ